MQIGNLFTLKNYLYKKFSFFQKTLAIHIACDNIAFLSTSGDGGMADALDSGSSGGNTVRVQVPFSALANERETL